MKTKPKSINICRLERLAVLAALRERCLKHLNRPGQGEGAPDVVGCDPVLLAHTLRASQVTGSDLSHWRHRLEPEAAERLTDSLAAIEDVPEEGVLPSLAEWRHAYGCAVGARQLLEWMGDGDSEIAYLGGLLHDIGRRVLNEIDHAALVEIYSKGVGPWVCGSEEEVFGCDHSEAGSRAVEAWGLPAPLPDLVRYHHSGAPQDHPHSNAISAILIANRLADLFYGEPEGQRTNIYEIERTAKDLLEISPQVLEEVLAGMVSAVQETAVSLGLESDGGGQDTRRLVETNLKISHIHLSLERSNRTLEEKLEQLRLLGEISELINRERDTEILFGALATRIAKIMRVERVSMFLRSPESDKEMVLVAGVGLPEEAYAVGAVTEGYGITGYVADSGKTLVVGNLDTDERFTLADHAGDYRTDSFVSVPINVRDRTVAIIHVSERVGSGNFSDADVEILTTIAHQISISLETRSLLKTLAERNRRLEEANQTIMESTQALERERNKLSSILWSMGEGVVVCDVDREICLVNGAAETILRAEAGALLGRDLRLCGNSTLESAAHSLRRLSAEGLEHSLEETTAADGRTIRYNLSTIDDQRGEFIGTVVVLQDCTRLLDAEKARNEFVYHVSHELRTPLVSINGFASTILRDPDMDTATRQEFLHIILSEGSRLTRLIDDLLEFARAEQGLLTVNREVCNLDQLARLSAGGLTKMAEDKGIEIVVEVDDDLSQVTIDPDRIRQVLVNLLANAIKFAPTGSKVRVTGTNGQQEVLVTVTDYGPGIAPDDRDKVFDRFFQVRQEGAATQGTGLGLAIVKEIVDAHDGQVWVEESAGGGTTVTFTLPLVSD